MKATGIVRKIDPLGRIVLPMELRKVMELDEGTPIEILVNGDMVILRKYQCGCIFCGEANGVVRFQGKHICKECRRTLAL